MMFALSVDRGAESRHVSKECRMLSGLGFVVWVTLLQEAAICGQVVGCVLHGVGKRT